MSARPILRFARVREAAAIHALLWTARDDIPLRDTFILPDRIEWVRKECRRRQFWVIEIDGEIAGVMRLDANEVFYLVTADAYRRRGVAAMLITYAKKRRPTLTAKTKATNRRTAALLDKEGFCFRWEDTDRWLHFEWRR
ncbi:MAG TPA: GNAT family N-acetyltransferase [Methylobacter sp.]